MTKLTQMSLGNDSGEENGLNRRRIHLREISGDSESPLETVGQDLRAARLRRGDEIAQVSRALKIRKDHLEALEGDRIEDLPGKTYAIGFVRSYARYLGLDSAVYVERFKQDIAGRAEEQVREPAPIHQDDGRRLPYGWRIVTGAVAILLIWGAWHLFSSSSGSNQPVPPAPLLSPPRPAASKPPVAAAPAVPAPQPSSAATVPPAADIATSQQPTAVPPPAAGAKTPETNLAARPAAAPASQGPANQGSNSQSPAAMPAVPAAPGAGTVYGATNQNPRVVLRARGDTKLTVRGPDGQIYINRDLKTGDSYQVPNIVGLTMAVSNAGEVEVDLDGVALGQAGQPQQILGRVSLDPQSLTDRFNNH